MLEETPMLGRGKMQQKAIAKLLEKGSEGADAVQHRELGHVTMPSDYTRKWRTGHTTSS